MNTNITRSDDFISIEKKWDSIYKNNHQSCPANVLSENSFLLPETGCALDLACGLGANALLLAEKGLETYAWDISSIALNHLQNKASQENLKITTKKVLIAPQCIAMASFDVIVISRFLDRSIFNSIVDGLKPNGLIFYQTYVRDKISSSGPKNPNYLLARNELLQLFQALKLVVYRENNLIGDLEYGERNEVFFVAQKLF